MNNELEKQFFKCFGIEPRYEDACTVEDKYWDNEELANEYGTFDQYMNCKCGDQENCTTKCSCAYQKEVYPQITNRILLELICILGNTSYFLITDDGLPIDVDGLKKSVLHSLTLQAKVDKNKVLKHQIRTLFEEEQ